MNLELFIAKRIHFGGNHKKKVSSPVIKIAITGIALGFTVMVLSVCIAIGFKKEVSNKIIGFNSHIQIANFDGNTSYETHPICIDSSLINDIKNRDYVKHVEVFATKPGIIKTNNDFQGIVFKGVSDDYDWTFFKQNLKEGEILNISDSESSNEVIISKYIADRMGFKLGDSFFTYFIQEPIKTRKFTITGIYSTNFTDYDKIFAITNIKTIQKLNSWEADQYSGLEIFLKDFNQLDEVSSQLLFEMSIYKDRMGNSLIAKSVKTMVPSIFGWLDLLDTNVWVIIILMLIVSGFTMISGLLIIILERANMIGILKALGAKNVSIRKIFLYVSSFLILKGMILGNIIALGFCFIQEKFGFIKLDPNTYYVSEMPVDLDISYIILLNVGAFIVSMLMMVGPSYLIAKISPAKTIKFE